MSIQAPDLDAVRLHGYYAATELDGNKAAYREMLLAHATRSATREAKPAGGAGEEVVEPEAFATPLLRYDAQSARRYERNNERSLNQGK